MKTKTGWSVTRPSSEFIPSKEAKRQGVCCTREEANRAYNQIDDDLKLEVLEFLKGQITSEDSAKIKKLIAKHGSREWLWHLYEDDIAKMPTEEQKLAAAVYNPHFNFGMAVRNSLRQAGYGEKELGIHNLDCCYVQLVEDAIKL